MTAAYSGAPGGGASGGGARDPRDEECGDFKRGKCDRGDSCRYVHRKPTEECRDFRAGRCTRGANCKFMHGGQEAYRASSPPASDRPRSRSRSR
mmetsp:Transcript_100778/g.291406  ORF Transcript_100778/g.291406 Transcript_100778/m.291406 type:complete len:94 (-) Transcript_100778:92-373(-)